MEDQKEIWDKIAKPWSGYRIDPIDEVEKFLKNKNGKILDLGCGSGRNFLKTKGIIYGVDFSENMLKIAKERAMKNKIKVELVRSEAFNLPFEDDFFDSAIFVAVLHCIPENKKRKMALKELLRVLKPNGEAWVSVWDKNQERFKDSQKESFVSWKHEGKEHMRYYYLYDRNEIVSLLKKTGFEILKVNDSKNQDGTYSKKNIDVIVRKPSP